MSFGPKGSSKSVGIKLSTWTPQSNQEASQQMFEERKELVTKWWEKWNGKQRAQCLQNMLGVCTNKQIRLLQEKLDERFPAERIDFTRDLPRNLSLHILSYLDPRSLSRCAQVSWYWKWLSEADDLWRPKCLRFGWYPPYKPSQFEHGAWKHFYILKVTENSVKPMVKAELPDPVQSARVARKAKKQKPPTKVWEPPPWRSNAPRPTDMHRNNVLDNSNFKKPPKSAGRPSSAMGRSASRPMSRSGTVPSRRSNLRSPTRSVSRSVQIKPTTGNRMMGTSVNPETIKDFEAALNSARSVHDAPLTPHQLSLTNQIKTIGGPGYGNKAVSTLDFSTLNLGASADFHVQDVTKLEGSGFQPINV